MSLSRKAKIGIGLALAVGAFVLSKKSRASTLIAPDAAVIPTVATRKVAKPTQNQSPANTTVIKSDRTFGGAFHNNEQKYNLPKQLLSKMASAGTGMEGAVVDGKKFTRFGEVGLMAINAEAHNLNKRELRDPYKSVTTAAQMMSRFLKKYDLQSSLIAFKLGESAGRDFAKTGNSQKLPKYVVEFVEKVSGKPLGNTRLTRSVGPVITSPLPPHLYLK